jgi:hypothetical protein
MIESVIRVVAYGQIQLGENRGVLVMMRGDNDGGGGDVGMPPYLCLSSH